MITLTKSEQTSVEHNYIIQGLNEGADNYRLWVDVVRDLNQSLYFPYRVKLAHWQSYGVHTLTFEDKGQNLTQPIRTPFSLQIRDVHVNGL